MLTLSARAVDQVTVTIAVTNQLWGTTNDNTITINGSTRTFTNSTSYSPSTMILASNTIPRAKTNIYNHFALYPVGSGATLLLLGDVSTNQLKLIGQPSQVLSASVVGGWGTVTLTTNTLGGETAVRVPISSQGAAQRTNIASDIEAALNNYSTNKIVGRTITNATIMGGTVTNATFTNMVLFNGTAGYITNGIFTNAVITNVSALSGTLTALTNGRITGVAVTNAVITNSIYSGSAYWITNGTFTNAIVTNGTFSGTVSRFTNGYATNLVLHSPLLTNAINYGNAFRSPGGGSFSENIGSGASATTNFGSAFGNGAVAGWAGSSFGYNASANYTNASAFGSGAEVVAAGGTAAGQSATVAAPDGTAIGKSAVVGDLHTNSTALGKGSTTTARDQVMLGASDHTVTIPGALSAAYQTNSTLAGTNNITGDVAFNMVTITSIANGNNVAVPGTNQYVYLSGSPSAAFTICGLTGGRNGRDLLIQNGTGQSWTIAYESGVDPTAANRIQTQTGADVSLANNTLAWLRYNSTSARWWLVYPAASTNGIGEANTASNLGTSNTVVKPLFSAKSGVDLQFRSLEIGSNITPSITTTSVVLNLHNAPTNLASVSLLAGNVSTTTDGTVWNDSTQKGIAAYVAGMTNHLVGKIFGATATAASTNNGSATNLIGAGVGQTNLPANFFTAGKTLRLNLRGRYWSGVTAPTWTLLAKLGSTTVATATIAAGEQDALFIDKGITGELVITCRTAGGSGSFYSEGEWRYPTTSGGLTVPAATPAQWFGTATVDTAAAQTITVTAQPSSVIAANSIVIHIGTIEVLP